MIILVWPDLIVHARAYFIESITPAVRLTSSAIVVVFLLHYYTYYKVRSSRSQFGFIMRIF